MRKCNRCGEQNHDDARYCGTCGTVMPTVGGLESLVNDDASGDQPPTDDVAAGDRSLGPDGPGLQTSESVGAPTFGETGPASPPATSPANRPPDEPSPVDSASEWSPSASSTVSFPVVAAVGPEPLDDADDTHVVAGPPPIVRSARSASVVIAVLVVAAVVIIGGVFILLSTGTGGTDVARIGDDTATSTTTGGTGPPGSPAPTSDPNAVLPVDTVADQTVPTTPATSVVDTTMPVSTVPTATASPTTTPPTTAQSTTVPPTTVPPPTAAPTTLPPVTQPPTTPATTAPVATRGPGDLGLSQPILNEACDGRYITFVGSAVGDRPYAAVVDGLLDQYPGANYIWTRACPSLRQEFTDGADIYGVVFGPYASQQEACAARASGPELAYVRRISTFDPPDHTIRC